MLKDIIPPDVSQLLHDYLPALRAWDGEYYTRRMLLKMAERNIRKEKEIYGRGLKRREKRVNSLVGG